MFRHSMLECVRFPLVTPDIEALIVEVSQILMVDCPELRDSATYKLKGLRPPGNGSLEFSLKKLSHLWAALRCPLSWQATSALAIDSR